MDVNATAIEVSLDSTPIVKGVTLVVRSGEIAGIVGPNGSGKSTLGRLLAGINGPRTGTGQALPRSGLGQILVDAATHVEAVDLQHGVRPFIP